MNKKTVIITAITILVVIFVCVVTIVITKENSNQDKVIAINEKLANNEYTINRKTKDSEVTIIRKGDNAYKEEKIGNSVDKSYVKDGDFYVQTEGVKTLYKYPDSQEIAYEFVSEFSELENLKYTTGKEKINGKEYKYQEYNNFDSLLFDQSLIEETEENDNQLNNYQENIEEDEIEDNLEDEFADENEENVDNSEEEINNNTQKNKTRLYFSGNNLKYVKTIIGDKEELMEVNISYKADENMLELPSDYEIVEVEY